ncbi:type II toxin-antitoxin system HicB family antitoxin [Cyanobium sp. ATX 6A2]|uniref:type II toxin-antitoxin system HicB family antitoxin n=1 Tax=Cyanobium sp. ATX 6A2 TaxID=2823700 RepID=UPI0020CD4F86|nr:type II toxin-antitoxin system HicB family antitoxin [Cyanobium sp. ATX 6A2]
MNHYTAVVKQDGDWWVGWVEEVPGVNAQESSRDALLESLKAVLQEALEMNRAEARAAAGSSYEELALALRSAETWCATSKNTAAQSFARGATIPGGTTLN